MSNFTFNRAEAVDKNFIKFVKDGHFPKAKSTTGLEEAELFPEELVDLFETQVMSRHLDLQARILKNDNECFYTIGSSGHEGNAGYGKVFRLNDMCFLHYRSGAFMLQRAKQLSNSTPLYDTMLSFVAAREEPISGGRHKVFGSYPLNVPPQTSTIASHLPKAVGAALSISRAHELQIAEPHMPKDSLVFCSFGDASANHSTALGAINTASWIAYQNIKMPLVFICEDNNIGISVSTPRGWIERDFSQKPELSYVAADGLNLCDVVAKAKAIERFVRLRSKPVFFHIETVRMLGHAGSDMESSYKSQMEIEAIEFQDPLLHSARQLIELGILTSSDVLHIYESIRVRIERIGKIAIQRPKITDPLEIANTIVACKFQKTPPSEARSLEREKLFDRDFSRMNQPHHMAKLINWGLADILLKYKNTVLFGEDVAQKGGVYNVTEGLHKKFGSRRIFNSLLDEQAILGAAIGMAHNGFLPIPEIQFLAYVHNAEDQIRGEAATLAFFSQGQFTNPMVLRIAGLAYQKGFGGHFHNDNSLAVFRDIPGLIIAVPARGDDAVKMMRTCVREAYSRGRVCIFVEPIALYMTKDLHELNDKLWSFPYPDPSEEIELGKFGVMGAKDPDITIVTYGNGTFYSSQAEKILREKQGLKIKIVDLRWIAPIDWEALANEVKSARHLLIVEECRKTGSLSEAIVANLVEQLGNLPPTKVLAAIDCFIPLGVAAAAGLPKRDEIVSAALELVGKTKIKNGVIHA